MSFIVEAAVAGAAATSPALAVQPDHRPASNEKRLATLKARACLAGVRLYEIEGDNGRPLYVATRWALTRSFEDLDAVSRWLDTVGAPAA